MKWTPERKREYDRQWAQHKRDEAESARRARLRRLAARLAEDPAIALYRAEKAKRQRSA